MLKGKALSLIIYSTLAIMTIESFTLRKDVMSQRRRKLISAPKRLLSGLEHLSVEARGTVGGTVGVGAMVGAEQ